VLLQDTVVTYRYSDLELVAGLSLAVTEARRLRPDLFLESLDDIPFYSANDSTAVDIDVQYRVAFLYYMVGHAQLRDEEDTTDARAGQLLTKFVNTLIALG
jgi:hypothetical protein